MIVLDASAVIELVTATRVGRSIAERIQDPDVTLHAPHLLDLEVAQTLRRYDAVNAIDHRRLDAALEALVQIDLTRYPHEELLPRIWALRANLTAYDAAYVALAEALDATLLTCDARLARSAAQLTDVRSETV